MSEREWVSEWENVWVSEWVSEWENEWESESEWVRESDWERVREWVSEWLSEWLREWVREWVNEWVSEWVRGWVREWVIEREFDFVLLCDLLNLSNTSVIEPYFFSLVLVTKVKDNYSKGTGVHYATYGRKSARKTELNVLWHSAGFPSVLSVLCLLVHVTMVENHKAVVCCLLATSAIMLSEKKKRKRNMWSKKILRSPAHCLYSV
jgi:hypothetical protein